MFLWGKGAGWSPQRYVNMTVVLCVCTYIYIHTCRYMCIKIFICEYASRVVCVYIYIYTHASKYMCTRIFLCEYIYVYLYMNVHVYIQMCTCMYIHICLFAY